MSVLLDVCKKFESQMNATVGFKMEEAEAWQINFDEELNLATDFVGQSPDIYDLLEQRGIRETMKQVMAMAFLTTGWAAPLDPNGEVHGPPSQHAERRRVRLTVVVCQGKVMSAIRFEDQDDDDSVIFDEGTATGSLASAILEAANG